jgi:hypothetical protein
LCFQERDIRPSVFNARAATKQMEGGATYWSNLLGSRGRVLVDVVTQLSVKDVIEFAQSRRPTVAEANGAVQELTNFFLAKYPSNPSVSEYANAAALVLGLPSDFHRVRLDRMPELAELVTARSVEAGIVAQRRGLVDSTTTYPPVPLETEQVQDVVETVAALMQESDEMRAMTGSAAAGNGSAAAGSGSNAEMSALATAGPASLVEQLVNATRSPERQTLLWLLIVSIPLLLQSFLSEARTMGLVLLTFFFGVMSNNTQLVNKVSEVLLSLQKQKR